MSERMTPEMLASYQQARYVIAFGAGVVIHIGEGNVVPDSLRQEMGDGLGVMLTAWNPHSVEQPVHVNGQHNEALAQRLRDQGMAFVAAFGEGEGEGATVWREDGFFVYPWTREQAQRACVTLAQNAVVALDANGHAELIFHPDL